MKKTFQRHKQLFRESFNLCFQAILRRDRWIWNSADKIQWQVPRSFNSRKLYSEGPLDCDFRSVTCTRNFLSLYSNILPRSTLLVWVEPNEGRNSPASVCPALEGVFVCIVYSFFLYFYTEYFLDRFRSIHIRKYIRVISNIQTMNDE